MQYVIKYKYLLLRIIPIFILIYNSSYGLDPHKNIGLFKHKIWLYENGLPFNTITSVVQTKDHYLWFGSKEGLIQFDGTAFTVYNSDNTPAIKNNDIWVVYKDSHGDLWAGTNGGGVINYHNGVFKSFTTRDGLVDNAIWTVFEDKSGNIWFGSGGGGLSKFTNGKFINYSEAQGLGSNYIWSIFQDSRGDIWIGSDGAGLYKFTRGKIKKVKFPSDYIFSMCEDKSGNILYGTTNGLIIGKNNLYKVYGASYGLRNEAVWTVKIDSDNSVWLGTDGGGIARFYEGKFENFSAANGLSSDLVSAIFEDNEKNIWVCTKGGGINRFKETLITTLLSSTNNLPNDVVYCVMQDNRNNMWFGTNNGLCRLSPAGNTTFFSEKDGMSSDLVISLAEDKNNNIWIGTDGGGLIKFSNNKFSVFNKSHGLSNNSIWGLLVDYNNNLWVGTDGGGLLMYNNKEFYHFDMMDGISGEFVSDIYQDRKGKMWISTKDAGLFYMKDSLFTSFSKDNGLLSDVVWNVYQDKENCTWIGTNLGLNCYRNGKFYSYSKKQGLIDIPIYSIAENDNSLWLSCNRGIIRVLKNDIKMYDSGKIKKIPYTVYNIADGMASSECTNGRPSFCKSKDGNFWYPTIRGAVYFKPSDVERFSGISAAAIKNLIINDHQNVSANNSNAIVADPGIGDIVINYSSITFASPENVQFKYILEGFDNEWVNAGTRRSAFYTNIPPGDYVFKVIAGNKGSFRNSQPASINITLEPHFWQTWYFKLILFLFSLYLVRIIYLIRLSTIKKQNKKLDRLVHERTSELKKEIEVRILKESELKRSEESFKQMNLSKDKFFSIISHDLRSPFLGFLGLTEMLSKSENIDTQYMKELISHIHSQAQNIFNLLNNLLEWSRLQRNAMEYRPVRVNLKSKVNEVVNLLNRNAGNKNINIKLDIPEDCNVFVDNNMLSSILQNIITNAIKFTHRGGKVTITAKEDDIFINIRIEDNGVGMPDYILDNIFKIDAPTKSRGTEDETGSGLGLILCHELVEKNHGKISVSSKLHKGSVFTISLPKFNVTEQFVMN